MIDIYYKLEKDASFQKIREFRQGCWVYVREATQKDLETISKITQIDVADLKDSLDKYELPRIEHVDDHIIFFVRHPGNNEFGLYTETLTMILTPSYVIAISTHRSDLIESLITTNTSLGTTQRAKLILHILLKITQSFTNSIKNLRAHVLGAEEPPKLVDSDAIVVLTKNEEILNQYLTSIVPMRNLLETMASGRYMNFYETDLDFLEDLMISMHQSEDLCRVNIKSIRSLRDSYHIIFTNDVNRTIKLLTAVTIIFTIPTIVASIYGMNVGLPFQNKHYAFMLVMGITLIASIIAVLLFRKNRWL